MDNKKYADAAALVDSAAAKGQIQKVIAPAVTAALRLFAKAEPEFCDAIIAKGFEGYGQCLDEIAKGVKGSSISDIECYRRAANFYFPGAGVRFVMKLDLTAGAENRKDILPGGDGIEELHEGDLQPTGNTAAVGEAARAVPEEDDGHASGSGNRRRTIELDLDDLFGEE